MITQKTGRISENNGHSQLIVGSCDGRVSVYEAQRGALLRSVEPALPPDARDLICAAPSPSGQVCYLLRKTLYSLSVRFDKLV